MKKHVFRISVVVLVIILAIVSFYMLFVHVPYYNYHHQLDEIRNEICETNNYKYLNYFNEHRGKEVYYVLHVEINNVDSYVAYNKEKELVDTYQGNVASIDEVKRAILDKYKVDIEELEVGYENNKFVYAGKYQDKKELIYVYYDLASGEFIKAVRFEE